jgi:hypothetical protein
LVESRGRAPDEPPTDSEVFARCLVRALDDADVRARERELLIEAHTTLGDRERAIHHMREFLEDYPRDRRGNRYRIEVHRHDHPDEAGSE